MLLQSNLFRIISIFAIILSLTVFAIADVITLKDGSVIKGKITSFEKGEFTIVIGEGVRQRQMKFFADEIDSVIFGSNATPASVVNNNGAKTNVSRKPNYQKSQTGNSKIITVGSAPRTSIPQTTNPRSTTTTTTPPSRTSTSPIKPIRIDVKVLADNTANGWTNAGWVVRKGQRIKITSNGRISLGNGRFAGPRGISTLPDNDKLIKDKPTGSLIAVIGDDNNDFIHIGEGTEFVAKRDGSLFLGINEGKLTDNTGAYAVTLEISTSIGN